MEQLHHGIHHTRKLKQKIVFSIRIKHLQKHDELAWMRLQSAPRHPYTSPMILVDAQHQTWLQYLARTRYYGNFIQQHMNLARAQQLGLRVVVGQYRGIITHEEVLRSLAWHPHDKDLPPPSHKSITDTLWYMNWIEQACLNHAERIEWWAGKRFDIQAPFLRSYYIKLKKDTVYPLIVIRKNAAKLWLTGEAEYAWRAFNPRCIIAYQTRNTLKIIRQPPNHPLPAYLEPA